MTIRRRLLGTFLLVGLLPGAVVTAIVSSGAHRMARSQGEQDVREAVETFSTLVRAELVAARSELLWAAHMSELQEERRPERGSGQLASAYVLDQIGADVFAAETEGIDALLEPTRLVLLDRGRGVAYTHTRTWWRRVPWDPLPVPIDELPPRYATWLRGPDQFTDDSRIFVEHRSTGALLGVAVAVTVGDGLSRVVIAEYPLLPFLQASLRRAHRERLERAFVAAYDADSDRTIYLVHPDPGRIGRPVAGDPTWERLGRRRIEASGMRDSTDVRRDHWQTAHAGDVFLAAHVDSVTGWVFGSESSLASVLAPVRRNILHSVTFFLLISGVVVLAILRATRGISQAVETIAHRTLAIARGDLGTPLRLQRSDEFGDIADHINRMADDLLMTSESRAIATVHARLMHELKGVVHQMQLLLYNARENEDDPEFRTEFFELMESMIADIEAVVLQLRRSNPSAPVSWQAVDVDRMITDIVESPLVALRTDVEVTLSLHGGVAEIDPGFLTDALENIISNALDAMENGGVLRISTGRRDDEEPGPTHVIEIEDTGIGMTREFVDQQLFRPFATTKECGTGLGMYAAKRLVDRIEGSLTVRSERGRGTCVTLAVGRCLEAVS